MKTKFFENARQQLIDKNPDCLELNLKNRWDAYVNQQFEEHKPMAEAEV